MTKQRIYRAIANRGREYAVVFGHDGNAYSVTSMGNHHMLWSAASGKPMGLAAACAVRAAIKVRDKKEADACPATVGY